MALEIGSDSQAEFCPCPESSRSLNLTTDRHGVLRWHPGDPLQITQLCVVGCKYFPYQLPASCTS